MNYQQQVIDRSNSAFWDELCGSSLARALGIIDVSKESLNRFDQAYFDYYPYLNRYVLEEKLEGKRILEIGLGYGTLGGLIASQNCSYFGLDIAAGPVKMMQYRLGLLKSKHFGSGGQGSALALPFAENYFDYVYTIGCLHHTGNLSLAVQEVHRVLKPGGKAIVMLYNQRSFRQIVQVRWIRLRERLIFGKPQEDIETRVRALYDTVSTGEAAPYTEYVTKAQIRDLFRAFARVSIDVQNFDEYALAGGLIRIPRKWFLNNLARILGLDLYIRAAKKGWNLS